MGQRRKALAKRDCGRIGDSHEPQLAHFFALAARPPNHGSPTFCRISPTVYCEHVSIFASCDGERVPGRLGRSSHLQTAIASLANRLLLSEKPVTGGKTTTRPPFFGPLTVKDDFFENRISPTFVRISPTGNRGRPVTAGLPGPCNPLIIWGGENACHPHARKSSAQRPAAFRSGSQVARKNREGENSR